MARNNEYVRRYLNLLKTNVIGDKGFGVQVKATDSVASLIEMEIKRLRQRLRSGKVRKLYC